MLLGLPVKLFLDDEHVRFQAAERLSPGWIWVTTVDRARAYLESGLDVEVLAVDNDLGEGTPEGFTLLDWLEERVYTDPEYVPPRIIQVHSMNSARAQSMRVVAQRILDKAVQTNRSVR